MIFSEPVFANIEKCGLDCCEEFRVSKRGSTYVADSSSMVEILRHFPLLILLLAIFGLERVVSVLFDLFLDDVLCKHEVQMSYKVIDSFEPKRERRTTSTPRFRSELKVERIDHHL